MVSFNNLYNADLSNLREAIIKWRGLPGQFRQVHQNFDKQVAKDLSQSDWEGESSVAALKLIHNVKEQMTEAAGQAQDIYRNLFDAYEELKGHQKTLKRIKSEVDSDKYLTMDSSGTVSFQVKSSEDLHSGQRQMLSKGYAPTVSEYNKRIKQTLKRATTLDETLDFYLRQDFNGKKKGFSASGPDNLKQTRKELDDAADEMAKLADKDGSELTNTQLNRLNSLASKYGEVPMVAERVATETGAEGTLKLWAGIADPYQGSYDPKRAAIAKKLQKNLSVTLATASHSDSVAMERWKKEMINLGGKQLDTDDAGKPRGFQVMSNLMRFGKYDNDFLNDYGRELVAYDKKYNSDKDMPIWTDNFNTADLNYWGKADRGQDPMTGFLEGLGHNPQASTEFFKQPSDSEGATNKESELNENLKYLIRDRNWHSDVPPDVDTDANAGRNSLGHALEAATTGYAYDDAGLQGKDPEVFKDGGERRNAATAGVMEQVVHLYAGEDGPKLMHDQPEMADSLGKMGGAYVDDINYAMSGLGEHAQNDDAFPGAYKGRAVFGNDDTIKFLSALGQNETSHGIMTSAERLYTLSELDTHPPTTEDNYQHAKRNMLTEAEVRGVLDHARVKQAEADFDSEAEEVNKSLERSTEWKKQIASTTVSAGVAGGMALVPVPGTTAAGVAMVPVAQDATTSFMDTFMGQELEENTPEVDKEEEKQTTKTGFFEEGSNDLGKTYDKYFEDDGKGENENIEKYRNKAKEDGNEPLVDAIKEKYQSTGAMGNEYRGHKPHKGE